MKITVHTIISVCCEDDEATEMDVLGTFIDENKARECFEETKQEYQEIAEYNDFEIYSDDEYYFEAGEDGNFNNNFVMLYWNSEEFEI